MKRKTDLQRAMAIMLTGEEPAAEGEPGDDQPADSAGAEAVPMLACKKCRLMRYVDGAAYAYYKDHAAEFYCDRVGEHCRKLKKMRLSDPS